MRIFVIKFTLELFFIFWSRSLGQVMRFQKYYNDHPIEKIRDYIFNENLKRQHIKWSDQQQTVYNIPVVVHVIHDMQGAENIQTHKLKVKSLPLMKIASKCSASNTPASFTSVAADTR